MRGACVRGKPSCTVGLTRCASSSPPRSPPRRPLQIIDSLEAVYHKVSRGGVIVVDDCGWDVLPGVRRGCDDFLRDKPETLTLVDFPDVDGGSTSAGFFIKA